MEDEKMLDLYRNMVRERHRIWLARQSNRPQPWTADPVLANRKFTNMFRVLDPGSQFVFELPNGAEGPHDLLARLVFYRITNLPSTWGMLATELGRYPKVNDFENPGELLAALSKHRAAGNRIFSGAYIIIPEPGTANDKVEGAVRVVQQFIRGWSTAFLLASTQEDRFEALHRTPGLGKFLSMQILTDWTYLQDEEPDLSFVVAGPGARRGAALLDSSKKAEQVIYDLAFEWQFTTSVVLWGRSLTVMDVQNTLCEFGKYAKEMVTPRKKTPYRPSHPGAQPVPRLPRWW